MTQQAMTVAFRIARDDDMYEVMYIRNTARQYMTHHTKEITPEQQYDWWTTKDDNQYRIWLVTLPLRELPQYSRIDEDDEAIIGFCMIRAMPEGHYYGTLAVLPEYRGKGIGTAIYRFMTNVVNELWIDIRADNIPSIRAATNAGFEFAYAGTQNDVDIVTLVHRKED